MPSKGMLQHNSSEGASDMRSAAMQILVKVQDKETCRYDTVIYNERE